MNGYKKMVFTTIIISCLVWSSARADTLTPVEKIRESPRRYDNRRLIVSGYVAEVEYIPHGERGTLNIKLTDDKIEPEDLDIDNYLLCQEVGYNIGILTRVLYYAREEKKKGRRIIVEGRYDDEIDLLDLKFVYLKGDKKRKINTDLDDISPYRRRDFIIRRYTPSDTE